MKRKAVWAGTMEALGAVEVQLHSFLPMALDKGKWSASRPARFTPGTHRVRVKSPCCVPCYGPPLRA
jgi:hypothetical protein